MFGFHLKRSRFLHGEIAPEYPVSQTQPQRPHGPGRLLGQGPSWKIAFQGEGPVFHRVVISTVNALPPARRVGDVQAWPPSEDSGKCIFPDSKERTEDGKGDV